MAAGLAAKGYRVLGIDLDPQGNFSTACGAENYNVQTIYEVMKRAASIQEAVQHTKGGYDVVPANIMLAGAEQELSQTGKEHRLKEAVAPIAADYDFIVIDTPPSLGVLTVNAFTCATDILIPTTAGIFATAGISQLNETVTSVQKYCNPNVKIRGMQDANKELSVRSVGSCRAMRPASPIRKMTGPAAADKSHRRRIGAGQFSNPLMHRPSQR